MHRGCPSTGVSALVVFHLRPQGPQWLLDESDASGFGLEAQNCGFRGENCKSDSPLDPCVISILWTGQKRLYFAGTPKCFSVSWRQRASPCTSGSEYRAVIKCTIPVVSLSPVPDIKPWIYGVILLSKIAQSPFLRSSPYISIPTPDCQLLKAFSTVEKRPPVFSARELYRCFISHHLGIWASKHSWSVAHGTSSTRFKLVSCPVHSLASITRAPLRRVRRF